MEPLSVDVANSADLEALADEVNRTGEERLLCRDGRVLARVVPILRPVVSAQDTGLPPWNPTAEDEAAFRSASGSWADLDTDRIVEEIYEARKRGSRPDARPSLHS